MRTPLKTAALLSGLIYQPWDGVYKGLTSMGLDMIREPFDIEGSQGMLVLGKGEAYLVFRGTEASGLKLRDVWSNFGLVQDWVGAGKAHSGYAKHFSYIRKPARTFAEQIPTPIPLYVAGHSLGGVLATLYAAWVSSGGPDDHKIKGLITYGAPKGLNAEGYSTIACRIDRVINRYDFAPHWPPIPRLTHPRVAPVKVNSGGWPGPVSRHSITKYQSTQT